MKNLGLSLPLSLRRPKKPVPSQRQPTRPIGEVENSEGFTRKIEIGRKASFRLANHFTPQVARAADNVGCEPPQSLQ